MKKFAVLAVSIVLVSIFFCPLVLAFPPITADVQMVQPDPSLPKELSAFYGKWETEGWSLVIGKVDDKKATLYFFPSDPNLGKKWIPQDADVKDVNGKYNLTYRHETYGQINYYFQDGVLVGVSDYGQLKYKPVQ